MQASPRCGRGSLASSADAGGEHEGIDCVPDAVWIAPIRHRFRKPPAHPELALRLSQQQQTAIRRLIAASKINCEFLAPDRWKVEGKQSIVAHGGCGGGLITSQFVGIPICYVKSLVSCHSRFSIPHRHA